MSTSDRLENRTRLQASLPDLFQLGAKQEWGRFRTMRWIFAGAALLFSVSGCLATRSWVQDQLNPINDQVGQQESRINGADAKADQALTGLQNLRLEHRLVLDSRNGPTFAFGSAALSENAKREIDGFFQDLEGSNLSGSSGRLFVVAGHTDSVGVEDYNYELGQRRADRVAGYLVSREGVDPTQVQVVSYGASRPVADNRTALGRRSNRRVEILVYQERIGVKPTQPSHPESSRSAALSVESLAQ